MKLYCLASLVFYVTWQELDTKGGTICKGCLDAIEQYLVLYFLFNILGDVTLLLYTRPCNLYLDNQIFSLKGKSFLP